MDRIDVGLIMLRSETLRSIREFFAREGFIEVIPPVLVGATGACENVPTVFSFDYFGKKAFLAQTTQLSLEWYVFNGIDRVYSVNKSFRAEARLTNRHQTEFTLIEFEAKDMDLSHLIEVEINLIRHVGRIPFKVNVISYKDAIEELQNAGLNIVYGDDLSSQAEQILTAKHGIVVVTHYPKDIKFFNMKVSDTEKTVECCDLLLPGVGEAIGGSERESRHGVLEERLMTSQMLKQLVERGGNGADFDWYLDLVKSEKVSRAGAGIGFDRLIQWLARKHSIKECVEFPRDAETLVP
jgi:asparaginyl-tRNA synthetase